ncbi:MAG TPA: ABC transporter permease [Bryobacteraceae bacterium]|nr:ABC transporter permease [Bryobacteraceae bacterium]
MPIPISYNVRNLAVRRVTTVMTALGTALSVAVLVSVMALVQGLHTSFEIAGNPNDILVMRKGSTSELTSVITRANFQDIKTMPGIVKDAKTEPMASLEMVTIINLADPNGQDMNVNVRGITPVGFDMRDHVHLAQGRWFQPGRREAVMGKSLADRFPSARIGSTLRFGRANGTWTVVGVLDGGRSVFNGEIWVDLNQISADDRRADYLSSVLLRAEPGQADSLMRALEHDARFNVLAQPEQQYYAAQMVNARPIQFMGILVAIIMAVGSVFAAMNTMYAAVARRSAEIGTLRVLGFSKASVLTSFVIESVFLAILGGAIGCILALPLNYINTDVGSFTTWSHFTFNFNVNTTVMLYGMFFALFIGAAGGFLPARNAAKRQIIAALKAR